MVQAWNQALICSSSPSEQTSCLLRWNSEGGQQMRTIRLQTQNDLTPLLMFRPVIPLYVQETDVRSKRLDPDPAWPSHGSPGLWTRTDGVEGVVKVTNHLTVKNDDICASLLPVLHHLDESKCTLYTSRRQLHHFCLEHFGTNVIICSWQSAEQLSNI